MRNNLIQKWGNSSFVKSKTNWSGRFNFEFRDNWSVKLEYNTFIRVSNAEN